MMRFARVCASLSSSGRRSSVLMAHELCERGKANFILAKTQGVEGGGGGWWNVFATVIIRKAHPHAIESAHNQQTSDSCVRPHTLTPPSGHSLSARPSHTLSLNIPSHGLTPPAAAGESTVAMDPKDE